MKLIKNILYLIMIPLVCSGLLFCGGGDKQGQQTTSSDSMEIPFFSIKPLSTATGQSSSGSNPPGSPEKSYRNS